MRIHLLPAGCLLAACSATPAPAPAGGVYHARLGDAQELALLRAAFCERNPGYDLQFAPAPLDLLPETSTRLVFVQSGPGAARLRDASGDETARSPLDVGDLVRLEPGASLRAEGPVSALVFHVPGELPRGLPAFIRPDWDPEITDTPGGCAEDDAAYRRLLLTWQEERGPYVYHGLNAHRVRITDSFTHYHPLDGGFDEFYLVQGVAPGARLLTSQHVELIETRSLPRDNTDLLSAHSLATGDLVYMPRGIAHRGLGGVLAQVIAVPGFRPGAEVGLDHHLRAIDESLGGGRVPYHAAAAEAAVVK